MTHRACHPKDKAQKETPSGAGCRHERNPPKSGENKAASRLTGLETGGVRPARGLAEPAIKNWGEKAGEERRTPDRETHIKHSRSRARKTHQSKSVSPGVCSFVPLPPAGCAVNLPRRTGRRREQVTYPEISDINMEFWWETGSLKRARLFDELIRPHSRRRRRT